MKALVIDNHNCRKVINLTESAAQEDILSGIRLSEIFKKDARTGLFKMTEEEATWLKKTLREALYDEETALSEDATYSDYKVVKHNGDSTEGYSVLVEDRKNNIKSWMDCWIEDGDVGQDWNQYIFSTTNSADKRAKKYQNNIIFFENVADAAIYYLVEKGFFVQDSDGNWSYGK